MKKVTSRTVLFADGTRKTLGFMIGDFIFETQVAPTIPMIKEYLAKTVVAGGVVKATP